MNLPAKEWVQSSRSGLPEECSIFPDLLPPHGLTVPGAELILFIGAQNIGVKYNKTRTTNIQSTDKTRRCFLAILIMLNTSIPAVQTR